MIVSALDRLRQRRAPVGSRGTLILGLDQIYFWAWCYFHVGWKSVVFISLLGLLRPWLSDGVETYKWKRRVR